MSLSGYAVAAGQVSEVRRVLVLLDSTSKYDYVLGEPLAVLTDERLKRDQLARITSGRSEFYIHRAIWDAPELQCASALARALLSVDHSSGFSILDIPAPLRPKVEREMSAVSGGGGQGAQRVDTQKLSYSGTLTYSLTNGQRTYRIEVPHPKTGRTGRTTPAKKPFDPDLVSLVGRRRAGYFFKLDRESSTGYLWRVKNEVDELVQVRRASFEKELQELERQLSDATHGTFDAKNAVGNRVRDLPTDQRNALLGSLRNVPGANDLRVAAVGHTGRITGQLGPKTKIVVPLRSMFDH